MTKRTILFLAANPIGSSPLALDREARAIHAELESSGCRDEFDFVTRWAAEPMDLLRQLRKLRPTVVHFSGHGQGAMQAQPPDGTPRRDIKLDSFSATLPGGLYFQASDGSAQLVSPVAIEQTFGAAGSSVRLVVLNACYSAVQAKALLAHVDCVIGMTGAIRDDAARGFAVGLYGGLGQREPVAVAFAQGRAAISLIHPAGVDESHLPRLDTRRDVDASQLVLTPRPADPAVAGAKATAPGDATHRGQLVTTAFQPAVRRELQRIGSRFEAPDSIEAAVLSRLTRGLQAGESRDLGAYEAILATCVSARAFYRSVFYLSKRKVLELCRLHAGGVEHDSTPASQRSALALEGTDPLSRAIALYEHAMTSGKLRLLSWPFDTDNRPDDPSLFYCIIASVRIFIDDALRSAFPLATAHPDNKGYASGVFTNTDPNLCPYISLVSADQPSSLSLTLSRRYLRISSSSVDFVAELLAGEAKSIVAFCYVEPDGAGSRIHPIACRMV